MNDLKKNQIKTPIATNLVGEIGINANGDVSIAKELIGQAVETGWQFVKFQKRTPELCVPEWKKDTIRWTPWAGDITYLQYKKDIEFSLDEYQEIFDYAESKGVSAFASVWDLPSVDFMANLTPVGKIPSAHLTNSELVDYAREKFDVLILSTGMSTDDEIRSTIQNVEPDVLMHSVSSYPTKVEDMNMKCLNYLRLLCREYYGFDNDIEIGYSGHDTLVESAVMAVCFQSTWIERHITLDKEMWGSDQSASIEKDEMQAIYDAVQNTESALGVGGPRKLLDVEKEKRKDLRK